MRGYTVQLSCILWRLTIQGTILVTGSSGFLGTKIISLLLRESRHRIIALLRAKDPEAAVLRASHVWSEWPQITGEMGRRVELLPGDVAEPRLGLDEQQYTRLTGSLSHIIHGAGDLRLDGPLEELRSTNVQGTAHILDLARTVHRDHGLTRLSHISTAYVAGTRKGQISEDSFTDRYGFTCNYERSKYEGEALVQTVRNEFPVSIFRPAQIVGDTQTNLKTLFGIYFLLRAYFNIRPRFIPLSASLKANIVPVSYVGNSVVKLTAMPQAEDKVFHLTIPNDKLPTAEEIIRFIHAWMRGNLDVHLPRPIFLPLPTSMTKRHFRIQGKFQQSYNRIADILITLAPYFHEKRDFLRDNVDRLLGPCDFRWQEILPPMLEFAAARTPGFQNRNNGNSGK